MSEPTPKAEVVPFGKYKGQPVEVLVADEGYRDWLMSQDWFRSRFTNIYQTIINYGAEPQETPEHNEMQASFLDDDRCLRLGMFLHGPHRFGRTAVERAFMEKGDIGLYEMYKEYLSLAWTGPYVSGRKFESAGWDVVFGVEPSTLMIEVESLPPCICSACDHFSDCPGNAPCRGGMAHASHCRHQGHEARFTPTPEWRDKRAHSFRDSYRFELWYWNEAEHHCYEVCPWSQRHRGSWLLGEAEDWRLYEPTSPGMVRVECKPDLGDDFPAVLRQVSRYEHERGDRRCVVVRRHGFEKVTWEQVVAMFEASGIKLIREDQLLEQGPAG